MGTYFAHTYHVSLAETAWRLVEIVSMDDRVDVPEDRSLYTVEFNTDGALVRENLTPQVRFPVPSISGNR